MTKKIPSVSAIKKTVRTVLDDGYFVKQQIHVAWTRAESDRRDGFPDRKHESLGVATSDTSDSTSSIALGPPDEIEQTQTSIVQHLYAAQRHIAAARRQTLDLAGLDQAEAQRIVDEQSRKSTECLNCRRIVTNSRDDRIVRGRCDTCYRYVTKHGIDREVSPDQQKIEKRYRRVKPGEQ